MTFEFDAARPDGSQPREAFLRRGQVESGISVERFRRGVGPSEKQAVDDGDLAGRGRIHQRSRAVIVSIVDIDAGVDEHVDDVQMVADAGEPQRIVAVGIPGIEARSGRDEHCDDCRRAHVASCLWR
jgi:hypothetical protein